ncbi:putative secreted hydrolase [Salmonella enterica subsp. enterica serovar Dublin str. SL1438]|nr:putative secreted hydrolase [Salmonella enterica subsp. enterica serovar Dublin str. SL1438]
MKKSKAILFIAPALFSYAMAAQACTTLAIQDKQGDIFHGRTLEYMQDLPSWLTYYPAGTQFDKKTPDGSQGISYQAKYPILAITSTITDGDSRDILEGMNSAGLSFSENMIMNAQLPPLPASEYKQAIPVTSLGEWALARFATVGEVKQAIFLPPERELAKQLGVSRASLREALIVLEISGWIVIQSGNGVIVSDKKHLASDYTIEEILSTRELVDSHCARLAAQNDNVDVINQIEAIYHRMDQAINDNNVHGFYSLDKEFHLAISEASRNRVLFDMSRMLWEQRINIPYAGLDEQSGDRNVFQQA